MNIFLIFNEEMILFNAFIFLIMLKIGIMFIIVIIIIIIINKYTENKLVLELNDTNYDYIYENFEEDKVILN